MQEKRYKSRLIIFIVCAILWSGLICTRLIYLQVMKSDSYRKEAAARQEAIQNLEPRRGTIFDRNRKPLAVSVESESLIINPQVIKNPSRTLSMLAQVLDLNSNELMKSYSDKKSKDKKFLFVKRRITPLEKREILNLSIDGLSFCNGKSRNYCESKGHIEQHFCEAGISFQQEFKRCYPEGTLASHLIGVSNIDQQGLDGVESQYHDFLKGKPIFIQATKDASGKILSSYNAPEKREESHLLLTIDEVIQYIAERELEHAFSETHAYKGCVIVMNPQNGEILALANRPTFNLNQLSQYPETSRKNIAIADLFEPGSTFKVIDLAALVELSKFHPQETIYCGNGSIKVAGIRIDDHHPYGYLSALKVIEESSNGGVIRLMERISDQQFYDYIKNFGFGIKTGIDLPGEEEGSGYVRPPSRWSKISHAVLSIGQEILVTPIQMISAYSAVANSGIAIQPHVAKGYIDPEGNYIPFKDFKKRKIISEQTARKVTGIIEGVVLNGTGKKAAIPGYSVAGKTGTAQVFDTKVGAFLSDRFVASFIGYAPAFNPEILCLVMLDLPKGKAYYGGDVAAPVFSKIVGETLSYLQIPPNRETLYAANKQNLYPQNPARDTTSPPFPSRALLVKNQADLSAFPYQKRTASPKSIGTTHFVIEDGQMPDLSGKSLREALGILSAKGCGAKISGRGYVTAQCPEAGAALNNGDMCVLLLSDDLVKIQEEQEEKEKKGGREQARMEGSSH